MFHFKTIGGVLNIEIDKAYSKLLSLIEICKSRYLLIMR